jgi:phosphoglucomutase
MPLAKAKREGFVTVPDLIGPYLKQLSGVVDLDVIRNSGLRIGIHPLGGASISFYEALRKNYGLKNLRLTDASYGQDRGPDLRLHPARP